MSEKDFGSDILLRESKEGLDFVVREGDLVLVSGRENLVQALTLRLSNGRGVLAQLGHLDYGSRLDETIGRRATRANLRALENAVREVVRQEPRVQKIERLSAAPNLAESGRIDIEVSVIPISSPTPLNLVVTLREDGG